MRYRLDPGTRLIDDDRVMIGGSPLTIFRLTEAGARLVRRVTSDGVPTPHPSDGPAQTPREDADRAAAAPSAAEQRLIDRFVDAGALHPIPPPSTEPVAETVIVPAFNAPPDALRRLAEAVDAQFSAATPRLIVDDAGPTAAVAPPGWGVLRLDHNRGPGGARNAGIAALDTDPEVIVFLDVDAVPVSGMGAMLAHFGDPRVGLVAARVTSRAGPSTRERYERWRSPLDLGPVPARVRAGTRVSYVPAAAIAVRREALAAVGGFDESLRFGEDVDLVWRLDAAGWRCRYEPEAVVEHEPRASWRAWWNQRVGYGSSAAPLAARHPGALAPARVSGWTAAVWALVAVGQPLPAVAVAGATTAALVRKLPGLRNPRREAVRLAGLGHLFGGRILASALWRAWWPIGLATALVSRRARRAMIAAAVIPALADWRRDRPDLDPLRAVALRAADDLAYGVGLWQGMLKHRRFAAVKPDLSNWPPRRRDPAPTASATTTAPA